MNDQMVGPRPKLKFISDRDRSKVIALKTAVETVRVAFRLSWLKFVISLTQLEVSVVERLHKVYQSLFKFY